MRKKRARQLFEKLEVFDAGAKGKAVAKAPDGRTVFISKAVPGDVVDVLTTKKERPFMKLRPSTFTLTLLNALRHAANISAFAVDASGSIWVMNTNSTTNKKR